MFFGNCDRCHNHKCHCGLKLILALVSSVITIASLVFTIMFLCEKKRRKEDRELEDYLENSIQ